jgi:hypothetical protein
VVFLGVIAISTLAIAVAIVAVLVAAGLLARRVGRLVDRVEQEMVPIFGHLNAIARDAARATALAGTQVERADRLLADVAERIEQILVTVQTTLVAPAREGRALVNALRIGFRTLLDLRSRGRRPRPRSDDDDALFI